MISMSQFRNELLVLARIMIKKDMHVDVAYKGRAYRVTIEDLHQDVPRTPGGRPRKREKLPPIDPVECPECRKLMIAGVCMNSACPSNL